MRHGEREAVKQTLQSTLRRHITFDPAKPEHRAAYWKLRREGRQDEELRFILEEPHGSVLAMMMAKIADHFSQPISPEVEGYSKAFLNMKARRQ